MDRWELGAREPGRPTFRPFSAETTDPDKTVGQRATVSLLFAG